MTSTENAAQIAFQQRDAASLHRHIRACPHGNANVRLRKRRRIVHSISSHRDYGALLLALFDYLCFLLRQYIGIKLDAELIGDCLGRRNVVSRDHDDLETCCPQLADRIGRGFFDWVGNANDARRLSIYGDQHHRLALFAQCFSLIEQWSRIDGKVVEEFCIPDCNLLARYRSLHALPGRGVEPNHISQGELLCFRSFHDGCRQRMFAGTLKAGYELQ